MSPDPSISPPPRQLRSRRTLERILSATERQLAREPFETITVRSIVTRARTSVGSFYARFPDKHALLPALYSRYESSLAAHLRELERSLTGPRQTLVSTATLIVRHFVRVYGERPHLMRALSEYARREPGAREQATLTHRRTQHEFMHEALLARARTARRSTSERAVATALFIVDAACRERLLYPTSAHATAIDLSESELVADLAHMLVAFLTTETTIRAKRRKKKRT